MDSKYDGVVREINGAIDRKVRAKQNLVAEWIAKEVCANHDAGLSENEDADFWRWASYRHIRDLVRREINKREESVGNGDRPQLVLHGFEREHLQDYYAVEREGQEQHVLVTRLTDGEIDAKVEEKENMGAACYAHAEELRRFKRWRRKADVATG